MKPMDSRTILSEIDRIRNLPTLPVIVFEANKLLIDPEASTSKVSQLIETDQSIAMKILKLVNSAFYGCPSNVHNLAKAIMLLGFNSASFLLTTATATECRHKPSCLKPASLPGLVKAWITDTERMALRTVLNPNNIIALARLWTLEGQP